MVVCTMKSKTFSKFVCFVLLLAVASVVLVTCAVKPEAAGVVLTVAGIIAVAHVKPVAKFASGTIYSAALANHSVRAAVGTLDVAIGGVVDYIEVQCFSTTATTVRSGGLVELENDALDWKPFQFYSQEQITLGTGGMHTKPMRLYVKKNLPSGSTITGYWTANNAATSLITITIHWKLGGSTSKETHMDTMRGTAAVGTLNTFREEGTIAIPALKGGNAILCLVMGYGAIETIVTEGGMVRLTNSSADWVPTVFCTGGITGLTTICGECHPHGYIMNHPLPSKSTVTIEFAPTDNQSQTLSVTLIWES